MSKIRTGTQGRFQAARTVRLVSDDRQRGREAAGPPLTIRARSRWDIPFLAGTKAMDKLTLCMRHEDGKGADYKKEVGKLTKRATGRRVYQVSWRAVGTDW